MKKKISVLTLLLLSGFIASVASASSFSTSYTLIGPQNTPGMTYKNGISSINQSSTMTYADPVNSADSMTVSGSFLATVTAPTTSSATAGSTVTTGSVLVSDTDSAGFAIVGGSATLTQFLTVVPNPGVTATSVTLNVDVLGSASVQISKQPTYMDETGTQFPWAAANAVATVDLQFGGTVLSAEAAPPLHYDGSSAFTSGPQFLNNGSGPVTYSVTPNAPIPIILSASISGGGVFSGSDLAYVDPTISLDPAFAQDYTLELTPLNVPSVPEPSPLALIGASCLLGAALVSTGMVASGLTPKRLKRI